ncbi:DNA dC-_dU-editing enzyme APOBEC-3C-like [Erethizon dorsatum]
MERSGWSGRGWLEQVCPEGCRWTSRYREPMKRLFQNTFYFHFKNLHDADHRRKTFLCFEVKREEDNKLRKGFFLNQVSPYRLHAELRFLSWFHDTWLWPNESYQVTWYVSWSPCMECAEQLATFLAGHRNVTLTIYVARLYYHQWLPYRKGLQALVNEGARVKVMFFHDFLDCWRRFVYNDGDYFSPWPYLNKNSLDHLKILQKILE